MDMIKKIAIPVVTALSLFTLQACDSDDDSTTPVNEPATKTTIVDAAVNNGNFTTLVAALEATGLDEVLADTSKKYTVFAPTDDAFALLGQDTIDALLADTDTLSNILTYHVIGSEVNASAAVASAGSTVEMVNGDSVGLSLDGDKLLVNTATVTTTDIQTDNGIIHVIDAVLLPPTMADAPTLNIVDTAVAAGNFTTLVAALQATGLDATLANESEMYTVIAPTDAAFALLGEDTIATLLANTQVLSDILLQHVVTGKVTAVTAYTLNGQSAETASGAMIPVAINEMTDDLTFGGANVVVKDIMTTNGIIHVIDMVVVADVEMPAPSATLVDVAAGDERFTTLVAALQATGLDAVLADTDKTYTVFAPTNDAFALLGQDTIDALLADADTLSNILLYHVVADAEVLADQAVTIAQSANNNVTMANQQTAALTVTGGAVYINTAMVTVTNIMADNGVIHVIDKVILPPEAE